MLIVIVILVAYVVVMVARLLRVIVVAKALKGVTSSYSRLFPHARRHMLVLGDSTMYGAGVENPETTVGGLLAARYPDASVETLAVNGAKIKDVPAQFAAARYKRYDLIIVGVGGNDIVRFSSRTHIHHELHRLLTEASRFSGHIILCHSVNIGNTGFFMFPLNYLFDYRSRMLSHIYTEVSAQFPHVRYVNFYRPMHADHYNRHTRPQFIARDAFHPSEYANRYFFDLLLPPENPPNQK